jgi:prepilin-type N-terminal cleavage/methylation domain-containing protein
MSLLMPLTKWRRHTQRRGYTVVELLMSIALVGIGVSGLIAMQRVTLTSNRQAKNLAVATRIAQRWVETLQVDAARWNHPSNFSTTSDLQTDTIWLRNVTTEGWFRPAWDAGMMMGPAFDGLGNPVPPTSNAAQPVFCTHLRLREAIPEALGTGVITTEVRVFWLRENGAGGVNPTANLCDAGVAAAAVDDPTSATGSLMSYHFVYLVDAVRQQTRVR